MRQRVSRLVRDALSFSKKLANHLGAIKSSFVTTTWRERRCRASITWSALPDTQPHQSDQHRL